MDRKKQSGRGPIIAHPRQHWPLFVLVLLKYLSVATRCKLELHTHKHAKSSAVTSTTWAGSDKSSWAFSEFKCELNGELSTKQGNRERQRTREHIKREGHHNGLCVASQTHRALQLHSYTGKRWWSLYIYYSLLHQKNIWLLGATHIHNKTQLHYVHIFPSEDIIECFFSRAPNVFTLKAMHSFFGSLLSPRSI